MIPLDAVGSFMATFVPYIYMYIYIYICIKSWPGGRPSLKKNELGTSSLKQSWPGGRPSSLKQSSHVMEGVFQFALHFFLHVINVPHVMKRSFPVCASFLLACYQCTSCNEW